MGAAALWLSPVAQAANFTVANNDDAGDGSLRDAIADAEANAGADTIDFAAGVSGTITLTSDSLRTGSDVTVNGPGARVLSIDGDNDFPVLYVETASTVTMSGLELIGGFADDPAEELFVAGGVNNAGTLTLRRMSVFGNSGLGVGGVINGSGTLNIEESLIAGNVAKLACVFTCVAEGGGIVNQGTLSVKDSTIAGNAASQQGLGGGIVNLVAANATISNSTITQNGAQAGAGIHTSHQGRPLARSGLQTRSSPGTPTRAALRPTRTAGDRSSPRGTTSSGSRRHLTTDAGSPPPPAI